MNSKKTTDKQALQPDENFFFDLDDIVSTTECTGLIPTPPVSEAEAEAYTNLYSIPKPGVDSGKDINQKVQ